MKKTVKIIGFFYRPKDGNEYILYQVMDRQYLTNGIHRWYTDLERRLLELKEVEEINMSAMKERFDNHMPYDYITTMLGEEVLKSVQKDRKSVV